MAERLFIFGLGYSASFLVRALKPVGVAIAGTVRSSEKAGQLRAEGIEAFVFDGSTRDEVVADALRKATSVIVSIPPGEEGDPVLRVFGGDIERSEIGWIGYLSTVGVYGNYGGAWVSERTTPHPRPGRSAWRLQAEKDWTALASRAGIQLAIFRIAGIYGPGRNAFASLASGKARRIAKPGQVFNRIHVEDIAAALVMAMDKKATGIFNLADDEPGPPGDLVAYAAEKLGIPPPPEIPFAEAEMTPIARSFYEENKRVLNRRLKENLGLAIRYPNWREGLDALWAEGKWR